MRANNMNSASRDDPGARIPSCALDQAGIREQQARYRQLAGTVTHLDQTADRIIVKFDEHLDRRLLERTLAVERECCPFFVFRFSNGERRLEISVRQPEELPALDVLAATFTKTQAGMARSEELLGQR